jgi:hypothetical protein
MGFAVMLAAGVSGQAGKPLLNFTEKEVNLGTISELNGTVSHSFHFTNDGKIPLIIHEAKGSCGCIVADWPREPILPGRGGSVTVQFNPKQQSGAFTKIIQVNSNAAEPSVKLIVRGVVIPGQVVSDVFKYSIGDVRLETIYAAFGEVYKGKTDTFMVKVFNTNQDEPVRLSFRQLPPQITARFIPESIDPQQEGRIELVYRTSDVKDWDYVVNRADLLVNGQALANSKISFTINIKEDFSEMTAVDLAMAPRVAFDQQQYDFGPISADTLVEHAFTLHNTGKTDLFIRKVTASCGCTAVQPVMTQIKPGDSTTIKAVFNSRGRLGEQKKAITVITNDPRQAKTILWILGNVAKP